MTTRAALLLVLISGGLLPPHERAAALASSSAHTLPWIAALQHRLAFSPEYRISDIEHRTSNLELQSSSPQRIHLAPKLSPGLSLRYQLDAHTVTTSRSSGRVEDPQGPSKSEVALAATLRLEILPTAADAPLRVRTTYEKSSATATSDSFDPSLAVLQEQYHKLEGRSIEFSLDAQGHATKYSGLEGLFPDEKSAAAAREWFSQLASGVELPREGIVPGQSWSSVRANVAGMPLLGLTWRTESTYLRDEPCPAPDSSAPASSAPAETCAVIQTRLSVTQRPLRDPTPADYRRRNMRTSGKLSSSGESLSYISLRTGWLVRVTQTSLEEMNIIITAADGGSHLRINASVQSTTHINLLPAI